VTRTRSIGGRSRRFTPGCRRRFSTKSQRAKLGSMTTFCPPICRKKLECPIKVTPSSPFEMSFGLWVSPVRGVTTECRTRRVNWPARLRRAGFFNEDFNIPSTSMRLLRGDAVWLHYRLSWLKSPVLLDAPETGADPAAGGFFRVEPDNVFSV